METQIGIRPARIYRMVLWDIVLFLVFMAGFLLSHLLIVAEACVPVVLTFDVVFLIRSRIGPQILEDGRRAETKARNGKLSLYTCAGIYVIGTIYGIIMITTGKLPWTLWPLLLFSLLIAGYCWKIAMREGARKSDRDNTRLNRFPNS